MFGTPEYQAVAKLDRGGEISAKVTAFCSYGSREASRSVEITLDEKDADKIRTILRKAAEAAAVEVVVRTNETDDKGELILDKDKKPLKEVREVPIGQQVTSDAAEAFAVATKKGETV